MTRDILLQLLRQKLVESKGKNFLLRILLGLKFHPMVSFPFFF